jgi:hypothetical protein
MMDVQQRVVIGHFCEGNFAVRPIPVKIPTLATQVHRNPQGVVYNLLSRAEDARNRGDFNTAQQLTDEAEKAFVIATSH